MLNRTIVVSLFSISLLVLTGIGYAAFTSTATVNANANAGTIGPLTWSNLGSGGCSTVGGSGTNTFTVSTGYMAPGDSCTVTGTLNNAGNLAGTLSSSVACSVSSAGTGQTGSSAFENDCSISQSNSFGASTIGAGGSQSFSLTITLPGGCNPSAGSGSSWPTESNVNYDCFPGEVDNLVVTVTATAGT